MGEGEDYFKLQRKNNGLPRISRICADCSKAVSVSRSWVGWMLIT